MRGVSYRHIPCFALITLLIMHFLSGSASTAIACFQCHGTTSPADYRPLDSSYRNITTGGFVGNHRTHMGESATPSSCAVCHPGSGSYTSSHRDGKIKVSSRANSSPLVTRYNNSTSAFPQTATPITGSCANVNCHFETTTPVWGSAPYNSTSNCNQCHDGTASLTVTHATHKRYSTGLMGKFSTYAACASCHVNYASPPSFKHATSAGRRPINVTVGGYNSGSTTYLPSQSHGAFGTCSNLYCHSPGTKATAPFTAPNQTATWGGSLTCKGCHKSDYASTDPILSGSHRGHIKSNFDPFVYNLMTCVKCHATTATASLTISDPSRHVNGQIEIAFNNTSSAAGGYYKGTLATPASPMTKTPGSTVGSCTTVYCHSSGQGANGSWPPTYQTPTWGNSASGYCGTCHGDQFNHGGFSLGNPLTSGSHTKHLQYQMNLTYSDYVRCVACHAYTRIGLAPAGCNSNLCHPPTNKNHANYAIDVVIPDYFGATAAYNGTTKPGDGYSNCSNAYCHSNGTSVATGTVPANTSPAWGSGAMACNGCHGNLTYSDSRKALPLYTTGKPKANSHAGHANHNLTCNQCHYATTTDNTSIADKTKHVNKSYDLVGAPGVTFTYTFATSGGTCSNISCHDNGAATWGGSATGFCVACHGHSAGYEYSSGKFSQGKGTWKVHASHTQNDGGNVKGPNIACNACHDTNNFPYFKSGADSNSDGKYSLSETDVCDTCHSPGGAYNGVTDAVIGAKNNWRFGIYTTGGLLKSGKGNWCLGCHDSAPAVISGQTATNKAGNGSTYGYYITGHGKGSAFPRMSWQDTTASGNPAAGRGCIDCHDSAKSHINTGASNSRLKAGYENQNNANCYQCHKSGGMANNAPVFYTTSSAYKASAHNGKLCTDCHDVHGSTGAYTAMTKGDKEGLCYQCHKDPASGGIQNNAISGASMATNIQAAFGMTTKHALGTSFTTNGKNYSLQCASCHNVHVVTGKYWEADSGKSPITRFTNNTTVWGASAGQKMVDYAGTGKYQKPMVTANTYDSTKLPDYATFCLDCHSSAMAGISAKDWGNDPHGKKTAGLTGMITGGGVTGAVYGGPKDCPDWKGCGRAFDWGQDRCSQSGTTNDCWPVIPRGGGTNAWVLGAYSQEERNAGVNYVLSCTDCHEAHGSSNYKLMRTALNREYDQTDNLLTNDRQVWDDSQSGSVGLCMQCHNPKNNREHSYNPGWHNNGTCATGPCHPSGADHVAFGMDKCFGRCHSSTYIPGGDNLISDPNQWATFHENRRKGNNQMLAAHEPGLVLNYKFESSHGRLKDSNSWNLHGFKVNGTINYVPGKVGDAAVFNDSPIEVGTEEHQWGSTTYESGGAHGNASKFTEMKYNTTVEAWVYPTSSPSDGYERKVLAKHNYWEGGYALVLKPVSGQYRAGFIVNVDYGGPTTSWDSVNCNGLRGAFSTLSIPINQWTHIAATFDTAGPDGTSSDLSVGRIRIYVNGHDVTTSETPTVSTNCWVEPKASETVMTPYTEFTTRWPTFSGFLATALSVGGLNWSAPNDNFIGRLDEVKLWNITKPVSYFDAINAADPPRIVSAQKGSSSNQLLVTFSEGVYTNNNATGALVPSDFTYTDADNGRTIAAVTHTAGSATATLTLSSPLDYQNDLDVDTLAAVTNQIFDDKGVAMDPSAVTITGSANDSVTASIISAVVSGANKITVTFNKGVYTSPGATGALVPSDFVYTDLDDGRTITDVAHTAGSVTAVLTLSSNLDSSNDIGTDTVAPGSNQVFDDLSRPAATTAVTLTGSLCPSQADFEMNWTAKNLGDTVTDESGLLTGVVGRPDLRITSAVGSVGSNSLAVTFSKPVYTNNNHTGNLTASDFTFVDGDNSRTITGVTHTAGATTATVTLSSSLDSSNDIGVDRIGAVANQIYDYNGVAMASTLVTIGSSVPGLTTAIPGDGYFHGDGMASMNFIKFEGQNTCLQATTNLTLEARIKPQGIPNDSVTYFVDRVFTKRADNPTLISGTCANCETYQMSVWRQPKDCLYGGYNKAPCSVLPAQWSPNYIPQPGVASIALMTIPYDWGHGDYTYSNKWKPVITEATNSASPEYCPIVNDHWYYVKVVWNSTTGGASGHPTADIFVEDQGTDGNGSGQNWTGLKNCTDADQSQFPVAPYSASITDKKLYSGDYLSTGSGRFTLGGADTDFSYTEFNGLIDWIKLQN